KWVYDQNKERMLSDPLVRQCQPAPNAFQMTLLGNEVSRLESECHKLTQQDSSSLSALSVSLENIPSSSAFFGPTKVEYALSHTEVHRAPAVNLTTQLSRQTGASENVTSGPSELGVLRESEVEVAWRDRQGSIFRKGTATSNMSNEELE